MTGTSTLHETPKQRLHYVKTITERLDRTAWERKPDETMLKAGLAGGWAPEDWAEIPWFAFLEPFLADPTVTDFFLNGDGQELLYIKQGLATETGLRPHRQWVAWLQRQLLMHSGLLAPDQIVFGQPDPWPHGQHQINGTALRRLRFAITRPPATPDGLTFAIRVLPARWQTLEGLIRQEIIDRETAFILREAILRGVTILICGGTGSGKTTMLAALMQEAGAIKRFCIIEECQELPALPNSVATDVGRSALSFPECVRFALWQRPSVIAVGEVKGPEGYAMLQAASTGHPAIATIHAHDPQSALKNLERMACEGAASPASVRSMLTSLPLLVGHIGSYAGKRRLGALAEVLPSGGQVGDRFVVNDILRTDPASGRIARSPVQGAWANQEF